MEWSWWSQWNCTSMNAGKWVNDVNSTSAHDVQDNGEGYNKVLIQLSAEDKMKIPGWSRTLLFWSTVILQICECTNIQKYSEIVIWMVWMRAHRSETWNTKEIRRKEEKCKREKK